MEILTVDCSFECDTPGCPVEFSISRYRHGEKDQISTNELLRAAQAMGWRVAGRKAYCPDCQKRSTA